MLAKTNISIIILIIFFVAGFFLINSAPESVVTQAFKYVRIGETKVVVELAVTPEEHSQGLSGRTELAEGEGMLFIFPYPDKYHFWMRGMNFAIDIIWINENMEVVHIKKNAEPGQFLQTFSPDSNAMYVLEVNTGFSDKHNVKVGDTVRFDF